MVCDRWPDELQNPGIKEIKVPREVYWLIGAVLGDLLEEM